MMDDRYRDLWKTCFGDSDCYIQFYFEEKAGRSRIYTDFEGDTLASMAYFTPYPVMYRGAVCTASYIVGVATREEYRHQGRMSRVVGQGIAREKERENPLVYLSPADPAIYAPLGFHSLYWRDTTFVERRSRRGNCLYRIRRYAQLLDWEKENVAGFSSRILQEENFDLYVVHSPEYYESVSREMQALDGEVLVFYRDTEIVGVADYIREEGRDIVTELICERVVAERVVESLLQFVPGQELTIEDSHFLSHLKGEKYRKERQERPYIMCRMLNGEALPQNCYINDIT